MNCGCIEDRDQLADEILRVATPFSDVSDVGDHDLVIDLRIEVRRELGVQARECLAQIAQSVIGASPRTRMKHARCTLEPYLAAAPEVNIRSYRAAEVQEWSVGGTNGCSE